MAMADWFPGRAFSSYEDFDVARQHLQRSTGSIFYKHSAKTISYHNSFIKDSDKKYSEDLVYKRLVLKCSRSGHFNSKSTGQRPNTKSMKHDCAAHMALTADRNTQYLTLKEVNLEHNHPICPGDPSQPGNRKLSKEMKQEAVSLIKYGMPAHRVRDMIYDKTGTHVSTRDVWNLKAKLRKSINPKNKKVEISAPTHRRSSNPKNEKVGISAPTHRGSIAKVKSSEKMSEFQKFKISMDLLMNLAQHLSQLGQETYDLHMDQLKSLMDKLKGKSAPVMVITGGDCEDLDDKSGCTVLISTNNVTEQNGGGKTQRVFPASVDNGTMMQNDISVAISDPSGVTRIIQFDPSSPEQGTVLTDHDYGHGSEGAHVGSMGSYLKLPQRLRIIGGPKGATNTVIGGKKRKTEEID